MFIAPSSSYIKTKATTPNHTTLGTRKTDKSITQFLTLQFDCQIRFDGFRFNDSRAYERVLHDSHVTIHL